MRKPCSRFVKDSKIFLRSATAMRIAERRKRLESGGVTEAQVPRYPSPGDTIALYKSVKDGVYEFVQSFTNLDRLNSYAMRKGFMWKTDESVYQGFWFDAMNGDIYRVLDVDELGGKHPNFLQVQESYLTEQTKNWSGNIAAFVGKMNMISNEFAGVVPVENLIGVLETTKAFKSDGKDVTLNVKKFRQAALDNFKIVDTTQNNMEGGTVTKTPEQAIDDIIAKYF